MRATGVIRRIDELGRVVIPKEIRKTMNLKEGESLEIYTDNDKLVFTKYSTLSNVEEFIGNIAEALRIVTDETVYIFDSDKFVALSGRNDRDICFPYKLTELIRDRKPFYLDERTMVDLGEKYASQIVYPIMKNGELFGGILVAVKNPGNENSIAKLAELCATLISLFN